jgi:histidinol dehydrogenase
MPPLTIRRIDCRREDARPALAELRRQLSPRGDVVSPAGRARTMEVFGEPLTPQQVVARICDDIRTRGLEALLDYSAKLDKATLTPETLRVSDRELAEACARVEPAYLRTLRRIRENVLAFQTGILHRDAAFRPRPGIELGLRYRPLRRVGICIPGGAAAYPSSLLMTAVPAQAAGVREIAVVVPPTPFGGYNDDLLAACHVLGITEVHRVGGAQAVAALAYGVEGIAPVDKIVGPGNLFVALAKQRVYGEVDIDSIAGPSEVVLLADWTADPRYVASDLISQAEHSPGASVLITWEPDLVDRVVAALEDQLGHLERGDLARESLERFGALIVARDEDEAVRLSNAIAPEHLHVSTTDPLRLAERLTDAGAIFLGHETPVAVGDYAAGPSHVLPTGGTARWASGLSANDFLRKTSLIQVDRRGLEHLAPDIRMLADKEGLTAHRLSVDIRLEGDEAEPASASLRPKSARRRRDSQP